VTGTLAIRIPDWAGDQRRNSGLYTLTRPSAFTLSVNGKELATFDKQNGYVRVTRRWQKGDVVAVNFQMPVSRVLANNAVAEGRGKAAVQAGPVIYCLEGIDNGGKVSSITLPQNTELAASFDPTLLGGVTVIRGNGVTAIPYYAWNNRGKGEMEVWIPY